MGNLWLVLLLTACGPSTTTGGRDGGHTLGPDLTAGDDAGSDTDSGTQTGLCDNEANLAGCGCTQAGATRACYSGPSSTRNQGLCKDGTQTCISGGEFPAWGPCTGDVVPAAESCSDNQDKNCNGTTGCNDKACAGMSGCCMPGETRPCYTGGGGTEGKGICKAGTQTCNNMGAWPADCSGETLPIPEAGRCTDTIDNDCDGNIDCKDADCLADPACKPKECQPGATKPCYTGKAGTAGVGPCKSGTQTCDQNGMWGTTCVGEVKPISEVFRCKDTIDNDCNGLTDCKDFVCLLDPGCQPMVCQPNTMQACYDGPNGTQNVGPCKGGMQTCATDGKSWGPCNGQVLPSPEAGKCTDNIDNDCNGLIDCKDPACATATNCCTMTGGSVDGTVFAHSPATLYRLDPNNWSLITVGDFNNGDQMTDIAMTPQGQLYGISFTSLYRIDKMTAKATYIADVPGSGNNALTFLPSGELIAADSAGDVKRINPTTGQVTAVGNFGNGYSSSGDMVAIADGTMFAVSATGKGGADASSSNVLLRVNVQTGVATAVGPIGYGGVWGLAYIGARIIAFTNSGQIVRVDPGTGQGTLLSTKNVVFWGAGMSPLVPANPCQ